MNAARLYLSLTFMMATMACGGDDTTVGRAATVISIGAPLNSSSSTAMSAGSHSSHSSLLPYIDVSKTPAAAIGFDSERIRTESVDVPRQNADRAGQFRITCSFSHMNFSDPIVFPGIINATHLHVFFGNTGVNHNSTQVSIEKSGNSTCAGGTANRTGYWVPAIVDTKDGTPLRPDNILVYYKSDAVGAADVNPFPPGLRMVAGDMKSTAPQRGANYGCLGPNGEETRYTSIPKDCQAGWILEMSIDFPMCWDGINLDSADHKSHMSFTVWDNETRKTGCPITHPIGLPGITEKMQYKVIESGSTARWRLSSDNYSNDMPGGYSTHADWFNGWNPEVQKIWIENCLKAGRDCHGQLLGNGTTLF